MPLNKRTILIFGLFISSIVSAKPLEDKYYKYLNKANKYYQQEKYKKASRYYHLILKKENENHKIRYKYADSLIYLKNYDLANIELKNILKNSNDDFVKKKARILLYKLPNISSDITSKKNNEERYSINSSDKNHYLCNGSIKNGKFSRWEKEDYPLKIYIPIPEKEKYKINNPQKYVRLVKEAALEWKKLNPKIANFTFTNYKKKANIFINWKNYFYEDWSIIGWGWAYFPAKKNNKRISNIHLAFRAQPGTAQFTRDTELFGFDLFKRIATHEFGHSLGLGHSPYKFRDIMSNGKKISKRDIYSLNYLYKLPINHKIICE